MPVDNVKAPHKHWKSTQLTKISILYKRSRRNLDMKEHFGLQKETRPPHLLVLCIKGGKIMCHLKPAA